MFRLVVVLMVVGVSGCGFTLNYKDGVFENRYEECAKFYKCYGLGENARLNGDYNRAMHFYERSIELDPESGRTRAARTYDMHTLSWFDPMGRIIELNSRKKQRWEPLKIFFE